MKIALLEYYITNEKTYVFVIRPEDNKPIVHEINKNRQFWKKMNDNFYSNLARANPFDLSSFENNNEEFYQLGKLLIDPIFEYIKDKKLLYIVPHQVLHYFPFHGMKINIDEGYKHLVELFEIVYLPSASVLTFCQNKNLYRLGKKKVNNPLIFGTWARDDIKDFIGSVQTELNELAKLFQVEAIEGLNASKQRLIQEITQSDFIHLASHGYFVASEDSMSSSGMLLNDGKEFFNKPDKKEFLKHISNEAFLSAREIFGLNLNCHLVTLSACETGQSENKPGDELIGLSRALLHAGTPSVLMSLWPVDVRSKLSIMCSFYNNWTYNTKEGKAKALQKAQIELLEDKQYNSLYHWGAYFLVGDWL